MPSGVYNLEGRGKWNKGRKFSIETKRKIGESNQKSLIGNKNGLGHKVSEEHKLKIIEAHKGKHHSKESRLKMSLSRKGRFCKENHPNWKGGISYNPYSVDWTKTLKRAVLEKYNYTCQVCNCYAWVVHHIDYNKLNCNIDNLIVVCRSCHAKTNFNREYWINYFKNE
jgi:hypothetical protein